MAKLELNSYESTVIEEEIPAGDIAYKRVIFTFGDLHAKAADIAAKGTSCAVVTTRTTWRGKNGKKTTEELSRTTYPAPAN